MKTTSICISFIASVVLLAATERTSVAQTSRRRATIATLRSMHSVRSLITPPLDSLDFSGGQPLPFPATPQLDLAAIMELRSIEFLDYITHESTFQHVGLVQGLERLTIGSLAVDCRIEGEWLQHFHNLQQLKELEVCSIGLDDACLRHLAPLKSLEVVSLDNNHEFSDQAIEVLVKLPALRKLSIYGDFTDRVGALLAVHPHLRSLSVSGRFTDAFLVELSRNANLKELEVYSKTITDAGIARIAASGAFTKLEFNSPLISDRGVAATAENAGLRELYLSSPRISDKCLRKIAQLQHLNGLALRGSSITNRGVKILSQNRSMERLFLEGSKAIGPECAESFLKMQSLQSVDLRSTGVNPKSMRSINRQLDARHAKP